MWSLVFICVSTVGGVPINPTQEATTRAPVGGVPFNETQNGTSPAPGTVVLMLGPPQQAAAETLEELQDNVIVREGDILIPEDRNAVETLWSDATVPYTVSHELADRRSNIDAAFKMISDVTCIRFQERTAEFNYLKFLDGKGCASFVGCRGGAQSVYYSRSCSVGNLCHEIIHALGLHHEHTREDRDQYVTVQWQSIMPGRQKNFKVKHGETLNLPYDLGSIMHYGQYFFSADGSPTVLPKHGGEQMGQRTHLSRLDVQRLNTLYHCGNKRTHCTF
ncbi:hatching enzyme 1.2-like [Enoplosus armatus]|uniref:hatching enzyme 1.2-like n=1 Tax=Enoplosus armatus TaxID=215367 RepID=UPI003994DCB2